MITVQVETKFKIVMNQEATIPAKRIIGLKKRSERTCRRWISAKRRKISDINHLIKNCNLEGEMKKENYGFYKHQRVREEEIQTALKVPYVPGLAQEF